MKRILLAESAAVLPYAYEALGVKNEALPMIGTSATGLRLHLVPRVNLADAVLAASDGIDLVLCGLHFDDSRMFDLLRYMKASPQLRQIPFVCIKTLDGALEPTFYESVKIALNALGADGFFDLSELIKKMGREEALNEVGLYIDQIILNTRRLQ